MKPVELINVRDALVAGKSVNPVTVREFLSWFDARRRGVSIVAHIRDMLEELSLVTVPDFEEPWIDGLVSLHLVDASGRFGPPPAPPGGGETVPPAAALAPPQPGWEPREAAYRLSRLEAANRGVTTVAPDDRVERAVTLMMLNDFSQLPVMVGERTVKGIVTWSGIATRSVLGSSGVLCSDFMVGATILDGSASIFDAIQAVVVKDAILVRDRVGRISGIVTAADLSLQFHDLSQPFLLLSEIETHVRNLIGETFSAEELANARAPGNLRDVQTVADLSFGEYVYLLQQEANWSRLGVRIDRRAFCMQLDQVREIRNQVMHFDPDGLEEQAVKTLREFSSFLKRVEAIAR